MPDPSIFVSYCRIDGDFAENLCTKLTEAGADVWLDRQKLKAGSAWDKEVEKALVACDCLLFIVSKDSIASDNVLNEVFYALEEKKKVLPVKIDDSKIPLRIRRLHYIDLSHNNDSGFASLLQALNINPKFTGNVSDTFEEEEEEKNWKAAKFKNTEASFQTYINNTVLKKHIKEAYSLINEIRVETERVTEDESWNKAKQINTKPSYGKYLHLYPHGKYSTEASRFMSQLAANEEKRQPAQASSNIKLEANTSSKFPYKALVQVIIGFIALLLIIVIVTKDNSSDSTSSDQPRDASMDTTAFTSDTSNNVAGTSQLYDWTDTIENSQLYHHANELYLNNPSSAFQEFYHIALLKDQNNFFVIMANYMVGIMFWDGYGVEKNIKSAIKFLTHAAEYGDTGAMDKLVQIYRSGKEGIKINLYVAALWEAGSKKDAMNWKRYGYK